MTKTIKIDGTKPFELMSPEERDEYFLKEFGMTWDQFYADAESHKDDPIISPDTKFL